MVTLSLLMTFLLSQVTASSPKPQRFEEINENDYADYGGVVTATPRSFNVRRKGQQGRRNKEAKDVLHLDAVTINSTPGNFRIIQPIQIVSSTVSPPR